MPVAIAEDIFDYTKQPNSDIVVPVRRFTFSDESKAIRIQVITYGATITSIVVPDVHGAVADVVLGFDDQNGYLSTVNPYFGATVGRVCNRIANAAFNIGAKRFMLAKNVNQKHSLHGGIIGFDKFNWEAEIVGNKVVMSHVNADGFEGYPGTVLASVTFCLADDGEFSVQFQATASKPTPINLTNHSYFNLAGHDAGAGELYKHVIVLNADRITETDADSIPTGQFRRVFGTPFDLRTPREFGPALVALDGAGFDDNFCVMRCAELDLAALSSALTPSTAVVKSAALQFVAAVSHRGSGRSLEVYSDQPGVQLYTSNYMPDEHNSIYPVGKKPSAKALNDSAPIVGKGGARYNKHGAFCLETQKFPDAVNHPNFGSTIVNPGEVYRHNVVYKFSNDVFDIVSLQ